MSFNFTGSTRRRNINLGNRTLAGRNRSSFLQNANKERRQRELRRKQQEAATVLQSAGRRAKDLEGKRLEVSHDWTGNWAEFRFFFASLVVQQDARTTAQQLDVMDAQDCGDPKVANCLIDAIGRVYASSGDNDSLIVRILQSLDHTLNFCPDVCAVDFSSLFTTLFELQATEKDPLFYRTILKYGAVSNASNTLQASLCSARGTQFVQNVLAQEQGCRLVDPFLRRQMQQYDSEPLAFPSITYLGNIASLFFFKGETHFSQLVDDTSAKFWVSVLSNFQGVIFDDEKETDVEDGIVFGSIKAVDTSSMVVPASLHSPLTQFYLSSFPKLALQNCSLETFSALLYSLLQFIIPQNASSQKHTLNSDLQSNLMIELIVASVSSKLLPRLYQSMEEQQEKVMFASPISWWTTLYVFEQLYSYTLTVTHDGDLFLESRLNKKQYLEFVAMLRRFTIMAVLDFRNKKVYVASDRMPYFTQCTMLSLKLLRQIYLRDLRMKLFHPDFWSLDRSLNVQTVVPLLPLIEQAHLRDTDESQNAVLFGTPSVPMTQSQLDCVLVLTYLPYLISFESRATIFHALINMDKPNVDGWFAQKTEGVVSREHILLDAFDQFGTLTGNSFKRPLSVKFVNKFGEYEAGIDGGGLTKELLTSLVKSFIPSPENKELNGGFNFFDTTSDSQLYPSADCYLETRYAQKHREQVEYTQETRRFTLQMFRFLGMVVGKCLYENVLIDLSFAPFFLNRWCGSEGHRNFLGAIDNSSENSLYRNSFDDLKTFDMQLYKSLVQLLKMDKDDLDSLDLTFTVTERLSRKRTVTLSLIPNGSSIRVTSDNRLQYVYAVARYKLDGRINVQTTNFLDGLFELIKPHWLSLFDPYELQKLISGGEKEIDIDDLQRNVEYGGYLATDITVKYLFEILHEFSPEQKTKFIKFATSSSKQPLLGFKELNPKFGIRNSGSDKSRLPTASTCVNLLKLPDYKDKELLRQKLLYSITADAGFDLS